jgi:hypothetical protein
VNVVHERKTDDKDTLIKILSPIRITMDRIQVYRLGKFNKQNNRLIKIIICNILIYHGTDIQGDLRGIMSPTE